MKKIIYLYLMGILNICSPLFTMTDEQIAQDTLQQAQKFIKDKFYKPAVAYLNELNRLKKSESDPFAQAAKKLEQELNQVLKNAQQFIRDHNYHEAYDVIFGFSIIKPGFLADKFKEFKKLLIQEELKDVKQFINKHDYKKLEDKIMQYLLLPWDRRDSSDPFSSFFRQIGELLFSSWSKDVQQSIAQHEYKKAYDILSKMKEWFTKLDIKDSDSLANDLKNLEKTVIDTGLKAAQDYAHQNTEESYKKAYEILNKLKALQIGDAARREIEIRNQEVAWRKAQNPIAPVQKKWIFIKQMPSSTQERTDPKSDWNITKKKELVLNLGATDAITAYTFVDLIKQAQDNQLPFILVMIQSGDPEKFFPHFFSVDALISLMQTWRATNKLVNPMNREEVFNIEIYVMGDDGVLRLLKGNIVKGNVTDVVYLENFVDYKGYTDDPTTGYRTHNYKLKPELEEPGKPGIAQVLIADLYKKQETAAKPELQQLERLWLSWALPKFSAADSAQKEQAIQRLRAIPNRPELIPAHKQVEQERLAQEAEEARKAQEAEDLRKTQEAEKVRQAEQTKLKQEQERLAREAEAAQRAEEARKAQEAEDLKKAQEAEKIRQKEQAKLKQEQERLAQEVEAARKNKEAEKLRQVQEEQARVKQKQERLTREEEAAKKAEEVRKAQVAEDLRKTQEAGKVRQAKQERLKQEQERLTREAGIMQTKTPWVLLSALHNFSIKLGQFAQELR